MCVCVYLSFTLETCSYSLLDDDVYYLPLSSMEATSFHDHCPLKYGRMTTFPNKAWCASEYIYHIQYKALKQRLLWKL